MRKETFVRTGRVDAATGAEIVTITVKVKDKDCTGEKRLFATVEQLGGLTDEYLLKCVNYSEDLLARAAITRANTDATGKKAQRDAAMAHWLANDKPTYAAMILADGVTQAKIDAALEKYYANNLAE